MKKILVLTAGLLAPTMVLAAGNNAAVDAYYHDMQTLTQEANKTGNACIETLSSKTATASHACRMFEQRYQSAIDQSQSLAAKLKLAGQSLHRNDPRLTKLTQSTETLNQYMDKYQAHRKPSAQDETLRISDDAQ